MDRSEDQKARQREATRRWRERRKAAGLPRPKTSDASKAKEAARLRERRAAAKAAGVVLPADDWFQKNPDKHRARVRKWRANNLDRARALNREMQAMRRSTPWGAINNRLWPVMHSAVRRGSQRRSKYTDALGYLWTDLRRHLESQFSDGMTWENWGAVWHLDHIRPVSAFQYTSLDDPLFREAWALSNIRPLSADENLRKGARI